MTRSNSTLTDAIPSTEKGHNGPLSIRLGWAARQRFVGTCCQDCGLVTELDFTSKCADCAFDAGPRIEYRFNDEVAAKSAAVWQEWEIAQQAEEVAYREKWAAEHQPLPAIGWCRQCKVGVTDVDRHTAWDSECEVTVFDFSEIAKEFHTVTADGVDEIAPTILDREDGKPLIYAGMHNVIYGLPGSGKTWVALKAALSAIERGGRVLWWDFEDPAKRLALKAKTLGGDALATIMNQNKFGFAGPSLADNDEAMAQMGAWLGFGRTHSLVVIDAAFSSGAPSDGGDVNPWLDKFVNPWKDWDGIGSLAVDHIPKRSQDRPAGPIGSHAKQAAIRGAGLLASGKAWTPDKDGMVMLKVEKDNPGNVGARGDVVSVVEGKHHDDGSFTLTFRVPDGTEGIADVRIPMLYALAQKGTEGVKGTRGYRELLKGKGRAMDIAMKSLVDLGLVDKEKVSSSYVYSVTDEGMMMVENGVESID